MTGISKPNENTLQGFNTSEKATPTPGSFLPPINGVQDPIHMSLMMNMQMMQQMMIMNNYLAQTLSKGNPQASNLPPLPQFPMFPPLMNPYGATPGGPTSIFG
jgi:hypothetical protein